MVCLREIHATLKYRETLVKATMTERTMADISHTAPHGASADRVWERGNEKPEPRADGGDRDDD